MANAEFPKAFGKVRGTISSRKVKDYDGTVYTEKLVAYVTPSGKQKIGIRRYPVRASAPTENELKARKRFAEAAEYWRNLSDSQKQDFHVDWCRGNHSFRGKKYGTLRGYVIARFYAGGLI